MLKEKLVYHATIPCGCLSVMSRVISVVMSAHGLKATAQWTRCKVPLGGQGTQPVFLTSYSNSTGIYFPLSPSDFPMWSVNRVSRDRQMDSLAMHARWQGRHGCATGQGRETPVPLIRSSHR